MVLPNYVRSAVATTGARFSKITYYEQQTDAGNILRVLATFASLGVRTVRIIHDANGFGLRVRHGICWGQRRTHLVFNHNRAKYLFSYLENFMRKIIAAGLVLFVAAVVAGCALNPFAEDNIYKRKNTEKAANETTMPSAEDRKAGFQQADADKNGVISKREGEKVSGLTAIFDKHDPDNDGTLDLNEYMAAMDAINATKK